MRTKFSTETVESLAESLNSEINIQGVNEPVVYEYFESLNSGEFMATAGLFAEQGCLKPPFDNQIQGREAIAQYLETEAKGMIFVPEHGKVLMMLLSADFGDDLDYTQSQIQIYGKVKTNWFTVNVGWLFQINAVKEIILVEVRLLAALADLFTYQLRE
jgi:hypothetical protein